MDLKVLSGVLAQRHCERSEAKSFNRTVEGNPNISKAEAQDGFSQVLYFGYY